MVLFTTLGAAADTVGAAVLTAAAAKAAGITLATCLIAGATVTTVGIGGVLLYKHVTKAGTVTFRPHKNQPVSSMFDDLAKKGATIPSSTYPDVEGLPANVLPTFIGFKFKEGSIPPAQLEMLRSKPTSYLRDVLKALKSAE